MIESITPGDSEYDTALKILEDAFSCDITQQYSVIEKLLKLKLTSNNSFFVWVSDVKILSRQVDKLDITPKVFIHILYGLV